MTAKPFFGAAIRIAAQTIAKQCCEIAIPTATPAIVRLSCAIATLIAIRAAARLSLEIAIPTVTDLRNVPIGGPWRGRRGPPAPIGRRLKKRGDAVYLASPFCYEGFPGIGNQLGCRPL